MFVRNPALQRLVAALLIAFVAVSTQAWAAHVDWPAEQGGEHAHVEITAFDGEQSKVAGNGDHSSHSDHCCHASAHLTGLGSQLSGVNFAADSLSQTDRGPQYVSLTHAPLIDPPIA